MRPRVVITHRVHREVIDLLAPHCDLCVNDTPASLPRQALLEHTGTAQAIMTFMPDRVDESFLAACPDLRIVAAALKGYDNFDVQACTRRGVWLTIVHDLLTVPTAELAVGLMLAVSRRMLEGDDHVRSGAFNGWRPTLYGTGLAGSTVGVIGMGAVGQALARRLGAFDMRILYCDPWPLPPLLEKELLAERTSLDELLGRSDFVLPLMHLTSDTLHIIDGRALARVKRTACVINVGRGSLVDEAAVAEALANDRLAGYAADVFEMEDWARDDRPRVIAAELRLNRTRTFFTPHIGSAVDAVRREIELDAARNILEALSGQTPHGAVNAPGSRAAAREACALVRAPLA